MSVWNLIILSGVAAAALIAIGSMRYLGWLGVIVLAYLASVLYWDLGGDYAEFFAGICDIAIVCLVAWKARYIWELWLGLLFLVSALVNWAYLANNVAGAHVISHTAYSSLLEVINIAAILMIGGVCSFDKSGIIDGVAFRPWMHLFGRLRPVYSRNSSRH